MPASHDAGEIWDRALRSATVKTVRRPIAILPSRIARCRPASSSDIPVANDAVARAHANVDPTHSMLLGATREATYNPPQRPTAAAVITINVNRRTSDRCSTSRLDTGASPINNALARGMRKGPPMTPERIPRCNATKTTIVKYVGPRFSNWATQRGLAAGPSSVNWANK